MISVIIPVYNVGDYLYICLNSLLKQSYEDFEIICIDDASTDFSLEILQHFSKKDPRIKIIQNESTMGKNYSRNKGLNEAQGKYILFLDGDDWFGRDAFNLLIKKSQMNNADVVLFKDIVYNKESSALQKEYPDLEFIDNFETFSHWDLDKTKLFEMSNTHWNKFYLKSFLDENNIRFPHENSIYEDIPFYYKVITSAKRVSIIDKYIHDHIKTQPPSNNEMSPDTSADVFFEDKELYDYYKKEILTCIFSLFKDKYDRIEDKDKFFNAVQKACKVFIEKHRLSEDIRENVDKEILELFKFDTIACEEPKISVIVPVYNVENYLRECLDSVLNQTFRNLEVICVDDGSTDNSPSILKEYQNHDSRIKIVTQKNQGVASARNTGLNHVRGKYVYFIDSDDYIETNALNELYNISESKDLDMTLFKIISFWDDSREKFTSPYFEMEFLKSLVGDKVFSFNDLGQKMYDLAVTVPGVLFKKDLISDLRFPDGLIFEDNVFFTEAIFKAKRVYFYDKHLYNYRMRHDSITHSNSNFSDIIEIRNMIIDLAEKYDNFYGYLYDKKLGLIKYRYSQTAAKDREDFFGKINDDFKKHKLEYESSSDFQNLPDDMKIIFYAGLNSDNHLEFEDVLNGKIKISVIMPVYNDENYVCEALESIEKQTLKDIEVICIDDGSTDNSIEVIEKFKDTSLRLKLIKQDNLGSGAARNKGLEMANGEYISFLDSDDLFEDPKSLEQMYNLAKSSNANMVSANLNRGDCKKIRYKSPYTKFYEKQMVIKPDEYEVPFYFYKNIFKNSFLRKNGISFPNLKRGQDPVFLAEVLSKIEEIPCLPVNFYYYRISDTPGLEKIDTPQKKRDYTRHFKDTLAILENAGYNQMFDNYIDLLKEFISHPNYNSDWDVYDAFCQDFGGSEIFEKYVEIFSVSKNE